MSTATTTLPESAGMTTERLDTLREQFDVVPIVRRMSADALTPVVAFSALAGDGGDAFLLESVERGETVGRYSFLGVRPRRTLVFDPAAEDSRNLLREELRALRVWNAEALPPFSGGAVGWFGYGAAGWSERLPDRHRSAGDLPDAELLFFDHIVAFDHVRQHLMLIANLFAADRRSSSELLADASQRLDATVAALSAAKVELLTIPDEAPDVDYTTAMTESQYREAVEQARGEIEAGEIFQVVLSQRWETQFPRDEALTLYRVLRSTNPSPYMFLVRSATCTLVGTSPEMLVRLGPDGVAESRPIAGTRHRSSDASEDQRLARELRSDDKEMAEHLMLVDLGRNDVGRVAARGSVRVTRFAEIERYSHVMHLVSEVRAAIAPERGAIDLFLSAFPAGTVSGAPKIRAMEIIDELEPVRRGPYAGAIAYFGFSGTLDSCIAIRMITLRDGVAVIQAGAGIVYDSVPEREYQECVNKSAALRQALQYAVALINREDRCES